MLFQQRFWAGLADGSITLTFRSWSRPQAKAGRRYVTPGGVLAVDDVSVVPVAAITDGEAERGQPFLQVFDRYMPPTPLVEF